MRIWDLPPKILCRQHLLAEHRELHAIWSILTKNKKGYSRHPETLRWQGKLKALYERHQAEVTEFQRSSSQLHTPLDTMRLPGREKTANLLSKAQKMPLFQQEKSRKRDKSSRLIKAEKASQKAFKRVNQLPGYF
jgi:hypothetical protein